MLQFAHLILWYVCVTCEYLASTLDCCSWRSWIQECMSYSLRLHWRLNTWAEPCLSKQRHSAMHSTGGLICQRKCAGTGQTQERMTDASLCTFCCSSMLLACPLSVHCHSVSPGFRKHNYADWTLVPCVSNLCWRHFPLPYSWTTNCNIHMQLLFNAQYVNIWLCEH